MIKKARFYQFSNQVTFLSEEVLLTKIRMISIPQFTEYCLVSSGFLMSLPLTVSWSDKSSLNTVA